MPACLLVHANGIILSFRAVSTKGISTDLCVSRFWNVFDGSLVVLLATLPLGAYGVIGRGGVIVVDSTVVLGTREVTAAWCAYTFNM